MARKIKCRWLKTFRLSWKCRKCKYRRRCEKVVKRRKFGMAMMVLIVIVLMVCGVWKAVTKENNVIQDEKVEFVKAEYFTKSKCQNIVPTKTKTPEKKTITPVEPTFTEVEIEALGKVIFKEAAGEPYIGKVAVGAVVMNRLKTGSREFYAHNGNIMDVILYDGAFASIEDFSDEEFEAAIEHDDCIRAANEAINGVDPTRLHFKDGALFFYAITEELSEKETKKRIGIDTFLIGKHAFHIEMH